MDKQSKDKSLGLLDVFAIASGAMISSGLFVLPAVIYAETGPAVVSVYFFAGILMIPSLLAKAELATAMPKAGGTYFFVERSLGTLLGTFAGFSGWFSITLKGAFALVGVGAFWTFIDPTASEFAFKIVSLCFVVFFTLINLLGTHSSARSQVLLVAGLLAILLFYIFLGVAKSAPGDSGDSGAFLSGDISSLYPMIGMVFVSFGGLTKVAAVANQIRNPGKTLPQGMIISFVVVMILYLLTIAVTVSIVPSEELKNTLTPLSVGALFIAGTPGAILLAVAALFAFATTANASILAASQNPAAMAEDGLLPAWVAKRNSKGVPVRAILLTGGFMIFVIIALDLKDLVKAASTMMLILFLLDNFSVILMRESRIVSYRPLYRLPLYPILPIVGILLSSFLIFSMGLLPLIFTGGFFLAATLWSLYFRPRGGRRDSALYRIVERMVVRDFRGPRLSEELGDILRERDGVNEDHFDQLIRRAIILDFEETIDREELFKKVAGAFSLRLKTDFDEMLRLLKNREEESTTLLSADLAIPHIILDDEEGFEIVLVRAKKGIIYDQEKERPSIVFALAGGAAQRNQHLKCLMAVAQITRSPEFVKHWKEAFDEEELRLLVLLAERSR